MEIKTGLSGRILPDEMAEKELGRELQKNKAFPAIRNKWLQIIIFCFAGMLVGGAAVLGYDYFFRFPLVNSSVGNNIQKTAEKQPAKKEFSLDISSNFTGASIYIDGNALSKFTPSSVSGISDGDHLLQIFQGNRKWETNIEIKNGFIQKINAVIPEIEYNKEPEETGSISLSSNPVGAKIFINNKDIQKVTPFEIKNLNPGNYLVSLSNDGLTDWNEEISISSGDKLDLLAILQEEKIKPESNSAVNLGWRKYENKFYGVKVEFPASWKLSELSKDFFDALFEENKDDIEYENADMLIVLGALQNEEPPVSIAISSDDKASILDKFSEDGFKKLEEESDSFGVDIFESVQLQSEKFAIIKDPSNPYTFLISFHDFGGSDKEELFNNFLLAFKIAKPEIF